MTLKNLIDESLTADPKVIMAEIQQLQQIDKSNAATAQQLKNNPDLAKQFQPFQTTVQQLLKQKQLEAQQAQRQAAAAQKTQPATAAGTQPATAAGTVSQ